MQNRFRQLTKIVLAILLASLVLMGFLYLNNAIGIRPSQLEADIRQSQKIASDWTVEGDVSDTLAAFISYPCDRDKHTISLYVNRRGLSFGYFFRAGGSLSEVANGIAAYTIEGYTEQAFISMNQPGVNLLEIDDGSAIQVIDIDSSKPFALVLPVQSGNVTFYDTAGNQVAFWNHPL